MCTSKTIYILPALWLPFSNPAFSASTVILDDNTPAYYNESLGTILNDTSPAFPVSGDPVLDFPEPPDLAPAQEQLGGWLENPPQLSSVFWTSELVQVPGQWLAGSESAIVYRFDIPAGGYSSALLHIGCDNGVFVWLDGRYLGGQLRPGIAVLGEVKFTLKSLPEGTHYLQVLREDHGGTADYTLKMTTKAQPIPQP